MGFFSSIGGFFKDVVSPIVSPVADVVGAAGSFIGEKDKNATAKQIARDNNAAAIELANTAHQREVKDLKAAGLNPILSVNSGGAASPQMQGWDPQNVIAPAVSTAMSLKRLSADLENIQADTDKKEQEAALSKKLQIQSDQTSKLLRTQEFHEAEKRQKTYAETQSVLRDWFVKDAQTQLTKANTATAIENARSAKTSADYLDREKQLDIFLKKIEAGNATARTVSDFLSSLTPMGKLSKYGPRSFPRR